MAKNVTKGLPALLGDVRRTLSMNQQEFADAVGTSKRTVQRWETRRAHPYAQDFLRIIQTIHPHDATLATEIAASIGQTLEGLGVVAPPPPPAPPVSSLPAAAALPPGPPPIPRHLAVDSVVCVASEALGVVPGAVRQVLLAAFRRARELGLSCDEVEQALESALKSPAAPAPKGRREAPAAESVRTEG